MLRFVFRGKAVVLDAGRSVPGWSGYRAGGRLAAATMATEDWQGCLRQFGWLDQLTDEEIAAIRPGGRCADLLVGVVVFSATASPSSVFLLRSGLVRIYRLSPDGGELTLGYVGPGELFGELGGFGDFPRESYAVTATRCRVCEMPQPTFRGLLEAHGPVVLDVAVLIGRRLKRAEARLASLVFQDVFTRMCATLLELAEDFGREAASGMVIDIPLTQADLATLIGAVRQTVSSGIRRLEERGVTARQGGRLVIVDRGELERLAAGGPSV